MDVMKVYSTACWGGTLPPLDLGQPFPITCDACAEAVCSVCGHEPCPVCVDCCDNQECIEWDANGHGKKTHECRFTPCQAHRSP